MAEAPAAAADVIDGAERGRLVIKAQEYAVVNIPLRHIIEDGRLNIYPELLKTTVLRSYSKQGELLFQLGGWIGYIPINDQLAIEVVPRVPIHNLERILCVAGDTPPIVLRGHQHAFDQSLTSAPESLLDILAERLCELAEACWTEGLHSEYVPKISVSSSPRGRLMPFPTALERRRRPESAVATCQEFVRTHDTAPNRCVLAALTRLYRIYSGMRSRKGARRLRSMVGRASGLFAQVQPEDTSALLVHPDVADPSRLPASRPSYPAAVALSKIILTGNGIDFRSSRGVLSLPPMMISMEDAFESYLRKVLNQDPEMLILDGNVAPPKGASTTVFHSAPDHSPYRKTPSTPDIVCSLSSAPEKSLVIDAKYKPNTDRGDLNQVLGYALTYCTSRVVLACPRTVATKTDGLRLAGQVGDIQVYHYFYDLGALDLEGEETRFRQEIRGLLMPGA